ncbi:MAG: hypothetical protein FWG84_02885 [Bacteroidales bacterium]|nr:hypothetical protein [Bacteroidales bacterium]
MRPHFYLLITVLIVAVGATGCTCSKKTASSAENTELTPLQPRDAVVKNDTETEQNQEVLTGSVAALPNVIIYKTKADYSQNVPVGLNEEKTAIVSYPGKTDVKGQLPVLLEHGFLLDKRGISTNVAFLKYTYDEYMALESIPPIAELFDAIIDTDPLTEMYLCGKTSDFHHGDITELLNEALTKSNGKPVEVFKKLK